jgi:type II secretory pathway component PulK
VGTSSGNVLQFYVNSGMNADEFAQVEGDLIGTNTVGLININTASEAVLACIPGIGIAQAPNIVAYRRTNADRANSVAWLKDILDTEALTAAGPWVIGRTYQYSADIAAVGRHGRGYARTRHIIDTTDGYSKIIYRQDLSHLGWALGNARQTTLALARQAR